MTATEPMFSKDPTSRMLGRITGGRGGRFAGKLTEAPRDSAVFRSIAVTYTYPEPKGWSFWRTPSLIYLSFVIRTPSIERPIYVHRQHLIWAWEYLRQVNRKRWSLFLGCHDEDVRKRFRFTAEDVAVLYEWEEESSRLFDTFGAHLDRLADFEEAGLKPCSFGQELMQVPQDNLYIPTIDVPTRPEYFPSAFFIYAIRVLQGRAGLSDLEDVHLRRKVQECISSTPEADYDIGNEASYLVSVKLDEEILDPVDEPEVARLIKVGAVPEQVCRHETLEPDTLTKLFREESLRVSVQGSRPLQLADDGLPGPYELFEPFLHFKPVEWLVTKASWEAEPLSTHSSRLESGEPNETRSV